MHSGQHVLLLPSTLPLARHAKICACSLQALRAADVLNLTDCMFALNLSIACIMPAAFFKFMSLASCPCHKMASWDLTAAFIALFHQLC
jgi:hypothetical protein